MLRPQWVKGNLPHRVLITQPACAAPSQYQPEVKWPFGSSFLHLAGHHTPYPAYPTSRWPIRNVLSIPAKKLLPKGQQPTLSQSPTLELQMLSLSVASSEGHPSSLTLRHWRGSHRQHSLPAPLWEDRHTASQPALLPVWVGPAGRTEAQASKA